MRNLGRVTAAGQTGPMEGALGLILPAVTGVLPVLTSVPPTLVLMGLSAFVAYGQFVA
jgi:hypothetical protein